MTNITENFVTSLNQEVKKINLDIENLNASREKFTNDKTNLEKELQELKELKRIHVSNVGQVIINNIIQELENKYKEYLVLNEKLSAMKELQEIMKECVNGTLQEQEAYSDDPVRFQENIASYFFREYRESIIDHRSFMYVQTNKKM